MKKQQFEMCLAEAKDQLKHINSSIQETRSKIYFLIGLFFAIIGYFSEDFFLLKFDTFKSVILIFTIPFFVLILVFCKESIVPLKLRFDGFRPDNFKKAIKEDDEQTQENILFTYQVSIDTNGTHLTKLAKGYNRAFKTLLLWLFLVSCFCLYIFITKSFIA